MDVSQSTPMVACLLPCVSNRQSIWAGNFSPVDSTLKRFLNYDGIKSTNHHAFYGYEGTKSRKVGAFNMEID